MAERTAFTHDDVEQILRLIDRLEDVEVTLETGDLKLHVRKGAPAAAVPAVAPAPGDPATPPPRFNPPRQTGPASGASPDSSSAAPLPPDAMVIPAPMLGTFHRAPSPAEPPFVEIGARVAPGDPLCIIEVMKLFNTVSAEVAGTIVEIRAENGAMVEFGQPLFVLDLAA